MPICISHTILTVRSLVEAESLFQDTFGFDVGPAPNWAQPLDARAEVHDGVSEMRLLIRERKLGNPTRGGWGYLTSTIVLTGRRTLLEWAKRLEEADAACRPNREFLSGAHGSDFTGLDVRRDDGISLRLRCCAKPFRPSLATEVDLRVRDVPTAEAWFCEQLGLSFEGNRIATSFTVMQTCKGMAEGHVIQLSHSKEYVGGVNGDEKDTSNWSAGRRCSKHSFGAQAFVVERSEESLLPKDGFTTLKSLEVPGGPTLFLRVAQ